MVDFEFDLAQLVAQLRDSLGIVHKQDIQVAAQAIAPDRVNDRGDRGANHHGSEFAAAERGDRPSPSIPVGDDCAAIPDGDGFLLLAAEGLLPQFVAQEPWFAGWCAVMVNVSDIYAMGGVPIALVDVLWTPTAADAEPLWRGMQAAAAAYGVPIVGGHTNHHSDRPCLAAAILGRAQHLLSGFAAQPGQVLLAAIDLRGACYGDNPFWNAATTAPPERLRGDLQVLPGLAGDRLCAAAKDISMGGVLGTVLMLAETSGVGATVDLDAIPRPATVPLAQWLVCFPSFGFILSVDPAAVAPIQARFAARGIACGAIGSVDAGQQVHIRQGDRTALLWDFGRSALTGFGVIR